METTRRAATPRAPTYGAPGAGVPVAHRRERAALIDRTDGRCDHHSRRPRGAEAWLGPEADHAPPRTVPPQTPAPRLSRLLRRRKLKPGLGPVGSPGDLDLDLLAHDRKAPGCVPAHAA